jgi:lysozyme
VHPANNNLRYDRDGLDLTEECEGLRLTSYQDSVGVWTIGYGHTGDDVCEGQTITKEEADQLLMDDVLDAEHAVHLMVNVPLTQGQYNALVDFVFNLGAQRLRESTLLRKLNARDYLGADAEFDKWNRAGGKVLAGLARRRDLEQAMFDDEAPNVGAA